MQLNLSPFKKQLFVENVKLQCMEYKYNNNQLFFFIHYLFYFVLEKLKYSKNEFNFMENFFKKKYSVKRCMHITKIYDLTNVNYFYSKRHFLTFNVNALKIYLIK